MKAAIMKHARIVKLLKAQLVKNHGHTAKKVQASSTAKSASKKQV
jgi:hypothetical protein